MAYEAAASASASSHDARGQHGPAPVRGSYLFKLLVGLWSWGLMSPQLLQKICNAVLKDIELIAQGGDVGDTVRSQIHGLAQIGCRGTYGGSCNQDLKRFLGAPQVDLWRCQMPMKLLGGTIGGLGGAMGESGQ